jgi:hypothetical protein
MIYEMALLPAHRKCGVPASLVRDSQGGDAHDESDVQGEAYRSDSRIKDRPFAPRIVLGTLMPSRRDSTIRV